MNRLAAVRDAISEFGFLAPLLPLMIAPVVALLVELGAPMHAQESFYAAGADVGVVLLVAIAIEARLLGLRGVRGVVVMDANPSGFTAKYANAIWTCATFLLVALCAAILMRAEVEILFALARGDFAHRDAGDVFFGLTFGIVAVGVSGLILTRPDPAT